QLRRHPPAREAGGLLPRHRARGRPDPAQGVRAFHGRRRARLPLVRVRFGGGAAGYGWSIGGAPARGLQGGQRVRPGAARLGPRPMTALPAGWVTGPGGPQVSPARFAQIIRSFRARLRASVARDPEERAAVDWSAVIADATNGITSDFEVMLDPGAGWDYEWL